VILQECQTKMQKAEFEMSFAPQFDVVIVNDDLEKAKKATEEVIFNFLEK
jgi:guanylate kinase